MTVRNRISLLTFSLAVLWTLNATAQSNPNLTGPPFVDNFELPAAGLNHALMGLGGDLSGNMPTPTVTAIQGSPVSSVAPQVGQSYVWNGTQFAPAAVGSVASGSGPAIG